MIVGLIRPTYSPAATAASTPEKNGSPSKPSNSCQTRWGNSSAVRYAANGASSETTISTGVSSSSSKARTTTHPTARPTATPPTAPTTNCRPAPQKENVAIPTATPAAIL
jgi:hypothetical protein